MSPEKGEFSEPFWKTGSVLQPLNGRLLYLDMFQDVKIAGMILVNNPGSPRGHSVTGPLRPFSAVPESCRSEDFG
jgi:hypothetical protein